MSWASGRTQAALALAFVLLSSACRKQEPSRAPAIGEGYVAPETLSLRKEIPLNSGTVTTVKRSERVEILQHRRRFVKVRTASNQEGWTEQSQLLTPEVYAQIAQMAKDAAGLPSWGSFRARDKLNLHMEP
ncbi:MAG: SH3 domain-containing protein, partial [Acidobacteria bacterium]|nr:SH3 domain-containing protein [Acidobacteriota bacterium]